MFKKKLAVIISCVIATSMLLCTACGSSADNGDTGTAGSTQAGTNDEESVTESSGEEVTVTIMCAFAGEEPHGPYVYEYADKFMEENPNIKIVIQAVSSNDIYTKLAAMATSPDDLPTLFYTNTDAVPTLNDLGLVEDMFGYLDDDDIASFASGIVDACTFDGALSYYPLAGGASAILYRTDWFEEEGLQIPATWEDFLDCAKALTKDTDGDGEVDQWGFSMVGSNNSSGQSRFQQYLWSNGVNQVSYDESKGEWTADLGDNFLEIFTFWTDMNNVEGVVPNGITGIDYETAANYFAMGYTGMMLSGSNALGVAYSSNPELKGKIGSFPIPGEYPGSMLTTEGYALCTHASEAEKEAAVDFLRFFSSNDEEYEFWVSGGKIPTSVTGQNLDYYTGDDYKGFVESMNAECVPTMNFAGMSGLKSALGDAYSAVFSGEKTNEDAMNKLISDMDELLEDYN